MAQQQFTAVRPDRDDACTHITERGEAITLCGRRTNSAWTRKGAIAKGISQALIAVQQPANRSACYTCAAALRKLQREGGE